MEYYDVKRMGLVLAVQAEIEGMKAENDRRAYEKECNLYVESDFQLKAEELRTIAHCHNEQL